MKRSPDYMISDTRKIFYSATSDKHDRVFVEVMTDTGYICNYFIAIHKSDFCDFTKSRVRLLRSSRVNAETHAAFLRTRSHLQRLRRLVHFYSLTFYELIECKQTTSSLNLPRVT